MTVPVIQPAAPAPAGPAPAAPAAPAASASPVTGDPGAAAAGPGAGLAAPPDGGAPTTDAQAQGADPPAPESQAVGSGGDAAAATSRPGQGTLRHEAIRHADRFIVEGDNVVQKNIYLVDGRRTGRLRLLSPLQIDAAQHAFVTPDGWPDVRAAVDRRRAVILHGRPGHGKAAAAIRLLLPLRGRLFLLDDTADLARLAESLESGGAADADGPSIERNAGFILNHPAGFAGLRGSALQGLEEALLRANARLILTVDGESVPHDQDLMDHFVELPAAPAHREVVSSHLRWRLGDGSRAERLLAREEVQLLVDEQLDRHPTCELAAWLAEELADEFELDGTADLGRITDRISRRGAQDFEVWFASLRDAETRCLAIALAVLGGLAHERIMRAARSLYRRIAQSPDMVLTSPQDGPYEGTSPFRRTRTQLLQRLRAVTRPITVLGAYGEKSAAQALVYRDPQYAKKVIEHVWHEYPIHDLLLDWLGELAEDRTEQVCVSAGTALGLLSTLSFEFLSRNVLIPWASSPLDSRRNAVAYALRVVAADPALTDNARLLTGGWYANRKNPEAQATAARVHGVGLGPLDPAAAVAALDRMLGIDHIGVAVAVGDSLADLLEDGPPDFAAQVLPRLEAALGDDDRTAAAQLCFLILADALLTDVPDPRGGPATVTWPSLLRHAEQDRVGRIRTPLAVLWHWVVNEAIFHDEAETVLTNWAGRAEADDGVRLALLRLLREVARGGQRSQAILDRYAERWVAADNLAPLPLTSAALRAVIMHERNQAR
jgi:hypothetical protein